MWVYLLCQSEIISVNDGGGSVGHRTHQGHSSRQSSRRAGGEVLLMGGAGLPQVNVDVDQT